MIFCGIITFDFIVIVVHLSSSICVVFLILKWQFSYMTWLIVKSCRRHRFKHWCLLYMFCYMIKLIFGFFCTKPNFSTVHFYFVVYPASGNTWMNLCCWQNFITFSTNDWIDSIVWIVLANVKTMSCSNVFVKQLFLRVEFWIILNFNINRELVTLNISNCMIQFEMFKLHYILNYCQHSLAMIFC